MFRIEFGLVFLCVSLSVVIASSIKDDGSTRLLKRYRMECIEETRVDPAYVMKAQQGEWFIPLDRVQLVKDWALCVFMKTGLMTKQGVYKIDAAIARVPASDRDTVETLIDSCLSKKAIPAPDIAFNFARCYQKTKANPAVNIV